METLLVIPFGNPVGNPMRPILLPMKSPYIFTMESPLDCLLDALVLSVGEKKDFSEDPLPYLEIRFENSMRPILLQMESPSSYFHYQITPGLL